MFNDFESDNFLTAMGYQKFLFAIFVPYKPSGTIIIVIGLYSRLAGLLKFGL